MSKPLNQTLKRAQSVTRRLASALRLHVLSAAKALDDALDADAAPTQALTTLTLASLEARLSDYERAQSMLDTDESGTQQQRQTRDTSIDLLRPALIDLASLVRVVHGPDAVAALELNGSVPREPEGLLVYASRVLNAAAQPAHAHLLTTPDQGRVRVDFGAMLSDVKAHRSALDAALSAVRDEQRSDQHARLKRDAAYAAWEAEARFVRDMSRALLRRVGLHALADRLLPSNRQIVGTDPIEPEPSDPQPDPEA